jgi:PAS domain S-box-containing protein
MSDPPQTPSDDLGEEMRLLLQEEELKRRRLEARLLKSLWRNEAHRRLAESNIIGVIFADIHGRIRGANDEFLRIVGIRREELADGQMCLDALTPPEHREKDQRAVEALERHGIAPPWEKELIARDGRRVPVLVGVALLEGAADQTIAFVLDLTERKRAEMRAAEYAAALRARNEEMEEDLRLARELQSSYLPATLPRFPPDALLDRSALRFHHAYHPAGEVGGDLFDIVALSDRQAGVLVCDVMGHGIRAALVTAMMRTLFEQLAPATTDPGQLLASINRGLLGSLRRTGSPMFVTACYAVVDASTGEVRWADAGHPSPLRVDRAERAAALEGLHGPALGLLADASYPVSSCRLEIGDWLLIYTDGIYGSDLDHGPADLLPRLQSFLPSRPDVLLERLLSSIRETAPDRDDVCVVAVERAHLLEPS